MDVTTQGRVKGIIAMEIELLPFVEKHGKHAMLDAILESDAVAPYVWHLYRSKA